MKKILLVAICVFVPLIGFAADNATIVANCPRNGQIIDGNNGKKFCVSGFVLNWYTTFTWCDSLGLQLASIQDVCDTDTQEWDGIGGDVCYNLISSANAEKNVSVWTSTPSGTQRAWTVELPAGKIDGNKSNRPYGRRAICH